MQALLRPRWLVGAALFAFVAGAGGLVAGESRLSPMLLLTGELLIIYAAILWTTPTIPPFGSRPAVAGTKPQPASVEQSSAAADSESQPAEHEQRTIE